MLSCLAKDPNQRPPSAAALARALRELDITPWSEADSETWWREQRPRIHTFRRKRAQKLGRPGSETVAVDLTQRVSAA